VVEQQLKNVPEESFFGGCFFGLAFAAFVGCVPKSAGKYGYVRVSEYRKV
jgi:hypothetical protein